MTDTKAEFPSAFKNTITTALGTVAALTWSDAIKTLFRTGGLFSMSPAWGPWLVAIVATCIAIWGSRLLALVTSKVETRFVAKNQAIGTIQGFNAAEPMMSVPAPIDQNIPGPPKKE
jgi:hypothetical protein